ncbi:MAG: GntR family transcriptional regulator, partial [Lachnospiraceae bacterium]|nr:GntR family transcriptional regulator [Lachnospiraceae bacterium]
MLIYDTEKKGEKPIYEYIYECIKRDIHSGNLKSGEKLPSRRQMALDNGIAEITVANAYSQLVT